MSSAAVAMSTVVGISVATTWIVSVQGSLPPSIRISDVNGAPGDDGTPAGTPGTTPSATGDTETPSVLAGRGSPLQSAASRDRSPGWTAPSPSSAGTQTASPLGPFDATRPTTSPSTRQPSSTQQPTAQQPATQSPAPHYPAPHYPATQPAPSPSASHSVRPAGGTATTPAVPGGGTAPTPSGDAPEPSPTVELAPADDLALHGLASADTANPYSSRASLELTVDEPLTALEVELRVDRSGGVADGGAWTTMPGVAVTVESAGDALVYRFALEPAQTALPGRYSFAVQYDHRGGPHNAAGDTWLASAFGVDHPRAVAARGRFS
ncbi:hypothetical protein [Peterkaempfera bronchialis]|uniref:hypothetical protein n=1 Tax=Peterkaempfera bronchialis TaxID=2126346 RepID=UPI003C2E7EE2